MAWNISGPEFDAYAGPKLDDSKLAILDHGSGCWNCVTLIEDADTEEVVYRADPSTRSGSAFIEVLAVGPNKIRILPGSYKIWLHKRHVQSYRRAYAFGVVELKPGNIYFVKKRYWAWSVSTTVWMENAKSGEVLIGFDHPIEKEQFEKELRQTEERNRRAEERRKRKDILLKLAEDGDVDAEYRLGFVDEVVEQWKWLCLAANKGSVLAQAELGTRFRDGQKPFSINHIYSLKWYSIASKNGDQWAKARARELKAIMTEKDISLAERIAQEWRPDTAVCEGKPGSVI